MLQRRGRPGCEGAGVVMARQYVHNACIRCPSLLLPHADAPARLPLGVPHAGGGACTLFSGEGDRPGSLVLHPLGRAMAMEMLASCRGSSFPLPQSLGGLTCGISTYRTPPLIRSGVPCWPAGASGHQLSSRRGKARALRHARLLFMRSSEDYSAGVPRLLCHTCAKCWNRAKNVQGGREDVPQA